jgi:dCTP deaminase
MLKSDRWIIRMAQEKAMIEPFEATQVRVADGRPVISYGVSSYGYDIRVGRQFKILDPAKARLQDVIPAKAGIQTMDPRLRGDDGLIVDPKNFDASRYSDYEGDVCIIPPHGMAIAQSLEYFRIPREVLVVCHGKSTYSRCGIVVSIAPLEPEWEGRLTFSITNTTALPAKVYAGEGIAQILFLESDEVCQTSYADKQGKYQRQSVLTPPKV